MAGRPPKPTEQLKLEGTYRKDRHADRATNSALEPLTAVECPPDITGKARDVWNMQTAELCQLHRVNALNLPVLEQAFRAYKRAEECMNAIDEAGGLAAYALQMKPGQADLSIRERQFRKDYTDLIDTFGVTPTGAAKVHAPQEKEKLDTDAITALIGNG
ncbi:MAG: P27 family phage terminase small subunit [Treponema sp.]|nr:P27 family phage terminase small subunit [Treponema sp.]